MLRVKDVVLRILVCLPVQSWCTLGKCWQIKFLLAFSNFLSFVLVNFIHYENLMAAKILIDFVYI